MPVLGVIVKREHLDGIKIVERDIQVLRRLAERVEELAQRSDMAEKRRLWTAHNMLKTTEPVIFCDPENGWTEIVDAYACEGKLARQYEQYLRKQIFWGEKMGDDRVIEPIINVPYIYDESDFGLNVQMTGGEVGGAYTWKPPLDNWEKLSLLHPTCITVDYRASDALYETIENVFSGMLEVRQHTDWWWSLGMTRELVFLRGMEQLFYDLIDEPEMVHALMLFLQKSVTAKLDFLTENGLLSANANDTYVGSGGFGYTNELTPCKLNGSVAPENMWGFAESQETISVSPEMFNEFIFPYQLKLLERFGLNCYGCCEPIDTRWDYIKKIPRLRRVSVSPWANKEKMAENLGRNYVYSCKANPSPLAIHEMDEVSVRKELKTIFETANGCCLEVIMKDNHTLGNNPENAIQWCRIAREMKERFWR